MTRQRVKVKEAIWPAITDTSSERQPATTNLMTTKTTVTDEDPRANCKERNTTHVDDPLPARGCERSRVGSISHQEAGDQPRRAPTERHQEDTNAKHTTTNENGTTTQDDGRVNTHAESKHCQGRKAKEEEEKSTEQFMEM